MMSDIDATFLKSLLLELFYMFGSTMIGFWILVVRVLHTVCWKLHLRVEFEMLSFLVLPEFGNVSGQIHLVVTPTKMLLHESCFDSV